MELYSYISKLKSSSPAPGGGSASAITSMFSASLNSMAALLSKGKKKLEDHFIDFERIVVESNQIIDELKILMEEDENSFTAIMDAFHIDKNDDSRHLKINSAIRKSLGISWKIADLSRKNMENALYLCKYGNKNLITDNISSAYMAYSTVHTSINNIKINLKFFTDMEIKAQENKKIPDFMESAELLMSNVKSMEENLI